jgi:two-component system, LuxR family, response regulator FixJ
MIKTHRPLPEEHTIAVVDDDDAVCNSLKFSLELEGFKVSTFPNASTVLDSNDLAAVRCFVVDFKLPGMNGLELVQALRNRDIETPVILITSHPNPATRWMAEHAHVSILEKPLQGSALSDRLRLACAGMG